MDSSAGTAAELAAALPSAGVEGAVEAADAATACAASGAFAGVAMSNCSVPLLIGPHPMLTSSSLLLEEDVSSPFRGAAGAPPPSMGAAEDALESDDVAAGVARGSAAVEPDEDEVAADEDGAEGDAAARAMAEPPKAEAGNDAGPGALTPAQRATNKAFILLSPRLKKYSCVPPKPRLPQQPDT